MGKAISYSRRLQIVGLRQKGQSYAEIAEETNCSISGVKKIWYRYQNEGIAAFKPNYTNCGRNSSCYNKDKDLLDKAIMEIRDNRQGASYVYSKLKVKYPDLAIPSVRSLQRWFVKNNTNNVKGRPSKEEKKSGVVKPMKPGKLTVKNRSCSETIAK